MELYVYKSLFAVFLSTYMHKQLSIDFNLLFAIFFFYKTDVPVQFSLSHIHHYNNDRLNFEVSF